MTKHILVPVDGSPQSTAALSFVAEEWPEATVTLLHVINPADAGGNPSAGIPSGAEEWYESEKSRSASLLADAASIVEPNVRMRTEVGRPTRTILDVVDSGEFDHVVMGSHGRSGVSRILLGSVTEAVVRGSPVPVTIVR
ncbi:universal stress protein UspA [Haloprofundus marisrubri]|uniref:Universal stress protein UspA n=1 Tax=Haloprofundus marisrubri TaxID=1514971 RepID=A0A0W1R7D7_9EURY|nr:universal stress protein [Haloprofundus marisrubri]KTG09326.1 universal stress protein UspA [Haloprofundus marisrubri]